jgi:hypothetical protein
MREAGDAKENVEHPRSGKTDRVVYYYVFNVVSLPI